MYRAIRESNRECLFYIRDSHMSLPAHRIVRTSDEQSGSHDLPLGLSIPNLVIDNSSYSVRTLLCFVRPFATVFCTPGGRPPPLFHIRDLDIFREEDRVDVEDPPTWVARFLRDDWHQ